MAIRKRSTPAEGKRLYSVGGVITISMHTEVEASSPEEARELAARRPIMSLCHQCSGGEPSSEWVTSGEIDCDEVAGRDEEGGELEVVEL